MKENCPTLTKTKRKNPEEIITNADGQALLANTLASEQSLLYSLVQEATETGHLVTTRKTEFTYFK